MTTLSSAAPVVPVLILAAVIITRDRRDYGRSNHSSRGGRDWGSYWLLINVPVSYYLFLIFQNGLHALESQEVCNASFVMFCFKGVKAGGPPTACIASALLEKEYWTRT